MNFFAHGHQHLHDPYFVAGTAIPDWLSVLNRKVRARSHAARPLIDDPDQRIASISRGVIQHHHDDAWFHQTEAFLILSARLSSQLRQRLPGDSTMRPSFLGHITVELLLDDYLIQTAPDRLDLYYETLSRLDFDLIERTVNRMSRIPADRLATLIPRFLHEKFLYDYATDEGLLIRINQVLKRVGLEPLDSEGRAWLASARQEVHNQANTLLSPQDPQASSMGS